MPGYNTIDLKTRSDLILMNNVKKDSLFELLSRSNWLKPTVLEGTPCIKYTCAGAVELYTGWAGTMFRGGSVLP